MFLNTDFGKSVEMLHRALTVRNLRHKIIANNIANINTPNFKRSTLNFEAELKRVLDQQSHKVQPQALMTHPRHMSFDQPKDWKEVSPRRVLDYLTQSKNNGNNVDLEQESMEALKNQMQYNVMIQAVGDEFARINVVLRR